ncbi:MAG TPA: hypothetical protein VK812_16365 [Candidatus Binatus sp.]|jgi:hypothetical protein|nr:hypothetical protein [Candidatus Binatus sp.]
MTSENSDSSPEDRSTKADAAPADKSEPITQLAPDRTVPPIQAPPAPHSYQMSCDKKKDRYDKAKFWAEMLGILFLIAYTYETYRTNNLTQCALNISKIQFATSQANAKQQFDQAQRSSTDQFREDQRPYVWRPSESITAQAANGEPVVFTFPFINYGKSPAIQERSIGKVFLGNNALSKADNWFAALDRRHLGPKDSPPAVIPPTATPQINNRLQSTELLTPEEWSSDGFVVVGVRIEYFDTSMHPYVSDMCWVRRAGKPQGRLINCERHNEIK